MKKRILILALALMFLLSSVPAQAEAARRYTDADFKAAIESGELVAMYTGLGGGWMDIADGETQVYFSPVCKVFIDPDVEAPEGYIWAFIYMPFMSRDGTIVWIMSAQGLMNEGDLGLVPPSVPGVYSMSVAQAVSVDPPSTENGDGCEEVGECG